MTDDLIRLENINYTYSPGTPFSVEALKDVTFGIKKGRITGIIGHTGSGKSTLVQLLNGLEKPSSGQVYLDGENIWEHPKQISKIRFRVGLVMQYPEHQLFEETVYKDIAFGPRNIGLSAEEIDERVVSSAEAVGLDPSVLEKSPFDLSGGQKRRVAIAGVVAMRPEVLVLDEPAAGLDPQGKNGMMELISKYRERSGTTVVIVSHSMEDMAKYCDDLVVMSDGNVFLTGTKEEVFCHVEELRSVGLGVPQVTVTLELLRKKGFDVPEGIYSVGEAVAALCAMKEGKRT